MFSFFLVAAILPGVMSERKHTVSASVTAPEGSSINDYEVMLKAGVKRLIFDGSFASNSGKIHVESQYNESFMEEIHKLATEYNAEVYLGLSLIFIQGNTSDFLEQITADIDKYFKSFYLDGLMVNSYLMPEYFEALQDIGDVVRGTWSWKTERGVSAIIFEPTDDAFARLDQLAVMAHFSYGICLLNDDSVPAPLANTLKHARDALAKWNNITRSPDGLEFAVIPEGRNQADEARSYSDLVEMGAPFNGTGLYQGFYYDSQRQIREKARLVRNVNMQGITFFAPHGDLPASDQRSLIAAALGEFH